MLFAFPLDEDSPRVEGLLALLIFDSRVIRSFFTQTSSQGRSELPV